MTVISALASFAAVAAVLTVIPGLDTALVLRAALTEGRRTAFATGAGISAGSLTWGAASALGVSALFTASQVAFTGLRLAGAAYLVWIGAGLLLRTLPHRTVAPLPDSLAGPAPLSGPARAALVRPDAPSAARAWWRGLVTNLLNPKVGIFYVVMIPQFLPAGAPHLLMGLALAGVHVTEGMAWFSGIILAAGTARRWLEGEPARRLIDRVTGTVLVAFGVRLAVQS